jgi:hypothetical protein
MTTQAWRTRSAAILRSASAERFDLSRFVRAAAVPDPYGRHVGLRVDALVPARSADARVEDVGGPVSRGTWTPPTELCDPQTLARRGILSEILRHRDDPDAQVALLATAFVHTHVGSDSRRRYAWPLDRSEALVACATGYLEERGTRLQLPARGAYALLGASHMCRAAPEPFCADDDMLDRSVGRHLALSFRETTLLSLSIEAGGSVAETAPRADTRSLLALDSDAIGRMVRRDGVDGICRRFGMRHRDVVMACRRRGVSVEAKAA